jgi:hypothetical protein
LVGTGEKEESTERRHQARQPFSAVQRVAPGFGGEVPPPSAFIEVRCHDLTRTGFSFFMPRGTRFPRLVVALGCTSQTIYVEADVLHWREVTVNDAGQIVTEGESNVEPTKPAVLVGCRFVRRLQEPA